MNKGFRHLWLPGCVAALLMTSGWANGTVFTMEVVDVNGSVPPNLVEVTVDHGDTLILEFFFADWDPHLLKGYQFTLAENCFSNGEGGPLKLTIHACTMWCSDSGGPCETNADCPMGETCVNDCFGTSLCLDGICAGDGLRCNYPGGSCRDSSECLPDPEGDFCNCYASVFIDKDDPDFVFPPMGGPYLFTDCTSTPALQDGYSEGGLTLSSVPDPGVRRYVGTILVTAPSDACGDYTISFNQHPSYTNAFDSNSVPILPIDVSATIVIHAPPCALEIVLSDPPNCEIDARQPHALNDNTDTFGWQSIKITFDGDASGLDASDFNVREVPFSTAPPEITSVTHPPGEAEKVILGLNRIISTRRWTCFALAEDADQEVCVGYLPGDVDASVTALADDIHPLIDHLNGIDSLPIYSVDIDRDGEAGPADILRLMDLLNGAADFDRWLGKFIGQVAPQPCPTAP